MAVQTKTAYRKPRAKAVASRAAKREPVPSAFVRLLPGWIILAVVMIILLPNALAATLRAAGRAITVLPETVGVAVVGSGKIAPLFTASVRYWDDEIAVWAARYNLDPNLLATIMQIESCGDYAVTSYAGAQGLFQVMPFHFASGENQIDPDTNAMRGADFLSQCLGWASGDAGLALACYNGGPSLVSRPYASWPEQTQRYFTWGTTIYNDARQNLLTSASLTRWLNAGGSALCQRAAATLGISG